MYVRSYVQYEARSQNPPVEHLNVFDQRCHKAAASTSLFMTSNTNTDMYFLAEVFTQVCDLNFVYPAKLRKCINSTTLCFYVGVVETCPKFGFSTIAGR